MDLDDFLAKASNTGGSFVGSKTLPWPDDARESLGLSLLLVKRLGTDERFALSFSHDFFYQGRKIMDSINNMTRQLIVPFLRDYRRFVTSQGVIAAPLPRSKSSRVFVVHGHDGEARESIARFLLELGLEPVILHEQASRGKTVIEKVEANSDVGFAVVLLTPDDEGRCRGEGDLSPRARQNVILELGFFLGRLGRERVCALLREGVEIPSDFAGVVWNAMDRTGAWRLALGRELQAAGYMIDWNRIMGATVSA